MSDMQDIRKALENQLKDNAGVAAANISFENTKFTPQGKTSWLRCKLVPAEANPAAIGAGNAVLNRGLFLVDCFVKRNNGTATGDQLADAVLAAFPYGLQLTENGKIINIRFSERAGAIEEEAWYYIPVTITWYCYF